MSNNVFNLNINFLEQKLVNSQMAQSPSQQIIGRKLENKNIKLDAPCKHETTHKFPIQVNNFLDKKCSTLLSNKHEKKSPTFALLSNKHRKASSINILNNVQSAKNIDSHNHKFITNTFGTAHSKTHTLANAKKTEGNVVRNNKHLVKRKKNQSEVDLKQYSKLHRNSNLGKNAKSLEKPKPTHHKSKSAEKVRPTLKLVNKKSMIELIDTNHPKTTTAGQVELHKLINQ